MRSKKNGGYAEKMFFHHLRPNEFAIVIVKSKRN